MDPLDRLIADLLLGRQRWREIIDRKAFLQRARLHGVSPLLHAAAHDPAQVPGEVREALRQRALRATALDLEARRDLTRLLGLMAQAGIHPILLKGAALAYSHYSEPGLRERADTDLLVRPDARARLFALLETQGFNRGEGTGGELSSSEVSFSKAGSGLVLDVHWRINNSPLLADVLEFGALEPHCVPVPALGPHARAPRAMDAVLLAAVHRASHFQAPFYAAGSAHRGDRLIWLYDLHLLVPTLTQAQASELAREASRRGVAGLCIDALRAAQEAFGTPLPPALMDQLAQAATQPEPSMILLHGGRHRLLLAELRALRGWRQRGRLLREHALPPADYMLRKYDTRRRWLLPALYVRRAFGWLTR